MCGGGGEGPGGGGGQTGLSNPGLASNVRGQNINSPTAGSLPGSGFAAPGMTPEYGGPNVSPAAAVSNVPINPIQPTVPAPAEVPMLDRLASNTPATRESEPVSFGNSLTTGLKRGFTTGTVASLLSPQLALPTSIGATIASMISDYFSAAPDETGAVPGNPLYGGASPGFGVPGSPSFGGGAEGQERSALPTPAPASPTPSPGNNIVFHNGIYYNRFTGAPVSPEDFLKELSNIKGF